MNNDAKVMAELLYLYDWSIRSVAEDQATGEDDDYNCGYADAIGQVILNVGKALGDEYPAPYKFEAYKRVMMFETAEKYVKDYPKAEVKK